MCVKRQYLKEVEKHVKKEIPETKILSTINALDDKRQHNATCIMSLSCDPYMNEVLLHKDHSFDL